MIGCMNRSRWWAALAIAFILLIGGLLIARLKAPPSTTAAIPPTPASVITDVTLQGPVQAVDIQPILATLDGTLAATLVEPGAEIYEGQLLAQLKNDSLDRDRSETELELSHTQERTTQLEGLIAQAKLEAFRATAEANQAATNLRAKQKTYDRQQLLFREGATPRLTFEAATRDYQTAQKEADARASLARVSDERLRQLQLDYDASKQQVDRLSLALDAARSSLGGQQIYAPANGLILERLLDRGAAVAKDQPIFSFTSDLSRLRVTVRDTRLSAFRGGQPASVILAEAGPDPLPGIIESIAGDQATILFRSPNPAIKPGVIATIRLNR